MDGAWYRAVITKVFPDRQVEVQYVDYGNKEELSISSLREPTRAISHVNSLPFQVINFILVVPYVENSFLGTRKLESTKLMYM